MWQNPYVSIINGKVKLLKYGIYFAFPNPRNGYCKALIAHRSRTVLRKFSMADSVTPSLL